MLSTQPPLRDNSAPAAAGSSSGEAALFAEHLFSNKTVEEVMEWTRRCAVDIRSTQEDLRAAIGKQHRELIDCCDAVSGMSAVCQEIRSLAATTGSGHVVEPSTTTTAAVSSSLTKALVQSITASAAARLDDATERDFALGDEALHLACRAISLLSCGDFSAAVESYSLAVQLVTPVISEPSVAKVCAAAPIYDAAKRQLDSFPEDVHSAIITQILRSAIAASDAAVVHHQQQGAKENVKSNATDATTIAASSSSPFATIDVAALADMHGALERVQVVSFEAALRSLFSAMGSAASRIATKVQVASSRRAAALKNRRSSAAGDSTGSSSAATKHALLIKRSCLALAHILVQTTQYLATFLTPTGHPLVTPNDASSGPLPDIDAALDAVANGTPSSDDVAPLTTFNASEMALYKSVCGGPRADLVSASSRRALSPNRLEGWASPPGAAPRRTSEVLGSNELKELISGLVDSITKCIGLSADAHSLVDCERALLLVAPYVSVVCAYPEVDAFAAQEASRLKKAIQDATARSLNTLLAAELRHFGEAASTAAATQQQGTTADTKAHDASTMDSAVRISQYQAKKLVAAVGSRIRGGVAVSRVASSGAAATLSSSPTDPSNTSIRVILQRHVQQADAASLKLAGSVFAETIDRCVNEGKRALIQARTSSQQPVASSGGLTMAQILVSRAQRLAALLGTIHQAFGSAGSGEHAAASIAPAAALTAAMENAERAMIELHGPWVQEVVAAVIADCSDGTSSNAGTGSEATSREGAPSSSSSTASHFKHLWASVTVEGAQIGFPAHPTASAMQQLARLNSEARRRYPLDGRPSAVSLLHEDARAAAAFSSGSAAGGVVSSSHIPQDIMQLVRTQFADAFAVWVRDKTTTAAAASSTPTGSSSQAEEDRAFQWHFDVSYVAAMCLVPAHVATATAITAHVQSSPAIHGCLKQLEHTIDVVNWRVAQPFVAKALLSAINGTCLAVGIHRSLLSSSSLVLASSGTLATGSSPVSPESPSENGTASSFATQQGAASSASWGLSLKMAPEIPRIATLPIVSAAPPPSLMLASQPGSGGAATDSSSSSAAASHAGGSQATGSGATQAAAASLMRGLRTAFSWT